MKKYLGPILITSVVLIFCTLTTIVLYAALETERSAVKEKQRALTQLKHDIANLKTSTRNTFASLRDQRITLKTKIETARTDFSKNTSALRTKLTTLGQDLQRAIDAFNAAAKSDPEKTDATNFQKAKDAEITAASNSIDDFSNLDQPLEI